MIDPNDQKKAEAIRELLAHGSKTEFWKTLIEIIDQTSSTEKFLSIKTEMGMKGFWYMKGYIQGQRDIKKIVGSAARSVEKKESIKQKLSQKPQQGKLGGNK